MSSIHHTMFEVNTSINELDALQPLAAGCYDEEGIPSRESSVNSNTSTNDSSCTTAISSAFSEEGEKGQVGVDPEEPEHGDDDQEEAWSETSVGYWCEDYLIKDNEARDSLQPSELHISRLAENGPKDYDQIATFFRPRKHKIIARRFRSAPTEIRMMIASLAIPALLKRIKPRSIRAIWQKTQDGGFWTYWSDEHVNKVPSFIYGFGGQMKKAVAHIYQEAPKLSRDPRSKTYPWFDYSKDTLELCYNRCGSSDEHQKEYEDAIKTAAKVLEADSQAGRRVKHLEVTYCNVAGRDFNDIFRLFTGVRELKDVTLVLHNHGYEAVNDIQELETTWDPQAWDLKRLPFAVGLETWAGVPIEPQQDEDSENEYE
ncbi:hypothetical protein G7Y89_g12723 [Cudoniella acicularis]|uniref:Uncharacterized protein n=1 Tax=Cudoniella acicularis TaxID=354080 RepID=A0A8H4RAP0_9HELO|nr:hypothetical protein G7Y89_g12723 [Cudoniella acicularis]